MNWMPIFAAGLLCGYVLPHGRTFVGITRHFLKCMEKRDKKIMAQARLIRTLKLYIVKIKAINGTKHD